MEYSKVTRPASSSYVLEQLNNIDLVCANYGLYAKHVKYKNEYSVLGAGDYIVVSTEPIPDDIKPYKICNRSLRNQTLFFPKDFAIKLTPENCVVALDVIMDFCEKSELIRSLYKEFNTNVPECIRFSEYNALKSLNEGRFNSDLGASFQLKSLKGLETFFAEENNRSSSFQENRAFWRSNRYDEEASWLQRKKDFANREDPVVRLNVLMQYSNDINKISIAEDVYQPLVNYLKNCYPEVTIAASEKKVFDNGMIELSNRLPSNHPALQCKPVTSAEFNKIIRDRFASEGWECVNALKPAKWEFRTVYYKEVDEPQFIAALNDLCFQFASPEPMHILRDQGDCRMVDISADDLYAFVILAKKYGVPFHIDNRGKFAMPSFQDIHIVYNAYNQKKMDFILSEMVENNIENSHALEKAQLKHAPSLNMKINDAKNKLYIKNLEEGNKIGNIPEAER